EPMGSIEHMEAAGTVRIVSRRMVRPSSGGGTPSEVIHLTPWDLRLLTIDHIQKGILLPKAPVGGKRLVDALASSLARALDRYCHFAGRLAVEELGDGTVTVALRCTGDGAELVHAAAPSVAVTDLVGSVYTPSPVVWDLFSLNGVLDADAAIESLPVLSAQVTELADGVFVAVSMNHSVGDGTSFWEFFNAWSEIHRGDVNGNGLNKMNMVSTPSPVLARWFVETSPMPIPLPFSKLRHVLRRFELPPVREGFFTFSAASVKKLKARANAEMAGVATAPISSLQALLAHLWRAVCRARRLAPGQETFYAVIIGCRGRVRGIPPGYVGNAVVPGRAVCAAGEVLEKGLGWTAWQLNRAVASFDEAALRGFLERWVREPRFSFTGDLSSAAGGAGLETGSSPRFDVFGNDFGWGRPVGVRSGLGDKTDGKATVFEGPERGGSMSLEVCLAPDALERLVADHEFMDVVTLPAQWSKLHKT
uniref:Acetyltransferase n=1 Tax=Aegilops tauschii subsp. strangulata TaxID=200361 RepID=A0A452XM90_AEGTS